MKLIITTYNTLLSCSDGCFKISNDGKEQKVSVKDVSAIHLSRGVQVTTDASMLAIENEIPVFLMLPAQKSAKTNDFRVDSSEYMVSEVVKKLSDLKHTRLFF